METIAISQHAWLKPLEMADAEEMFYLTVQNRFHLKKWIPWLEGIREVADSARFIAAAIEQAKRNQGYHFGIWYKGKLAGTVGVHGINWANRKTTIGYWLAEGFQGKGLMTEAVAAYLDHFIFGAWKLNRCEIAAATGNVKSRAIPERLGFQLEGIIRSNEYLYDHYVDHAVYGLLAEEWDGKS